MVDHKEKIDQYKNLIEAFADPCDGTIYHYTSDEGMRGIIENSEIWLTNAAFMNDTTECTALQLEKGLFSANNLNNLYVKNQWEIFLSYPYSDKDTYIVSFSRKKELLSQFHAYGNFCISFEAKKIIKPPFNFYRCVYSKAQIKKWILQKEKNIKWQGDNLSDQAKEMAAFQLIYIASRKYKNKHFVDEREIRLITVSNATWGLFDNSPSMYENDPPIHYRDLGNKTSAPYVKFLIADKKIEEKEQGNKTKETEQQMKERKLNDENSTKRKLLPITGIWIGPMLPNKKEAKIKCEMLLKDKGYENVKVHISNIPYRG